ncbi:MAG TPA: von Willebrand factor type A domain-containing protein [Myxococcota bacterium]
MHRLLPRLLPSIVAASLVGCAASEPAPQAYASRQDEGRHASADDVPAAPPAPEPVSPAADAAAMAPTMSTPTTTAQPVRAEPPPPAPMKAAESAARGDSLALGNVAGLGSSGAGVGGGGSVGLVERKVARIADEKSKQEGGPRLPNTEVAVSADKGGTFVHAGTNPFIETASDALSTFAVDVDTGSFTFARRFLQQGNLPPDAAVRVEEWVNAMHYSYAGPAKSSAMPFAVHVEGAVSPIAKGKHLVRVALQGKKVSKAERGPTHLVFLVDVSGSMNAEDKLPLARRAMHMMVDELRDDDSIALVTYAGSTGVVLPATSIKNKRTIHEAIDRLSSGGGTNMGSGMELAYREAQKQLGGGRSARVVVLSDGDANIGRTSHRQMLDAIKGYVSEGVMMSTVGFGTGNYNDHLMEQLSNAGNGNYTYIADAKSAERFFVHELDGTLETIAQDVKIQVEWNKDVVARYRLVGYENRDIADKDFRNDKKDAGEIGAGHAITALYELELVAPSSTPYTDLGTVRVRAKKPRGTKAEEIAVAIPAATLKESAKDLDDDAQAAVAVALAAEILRRSPYAEGRTLSEAAELLRGAAHGPHAAERTELARELVAVEPRFASR